MTEGQAELEPRPSRFTFSLRTLMLGMTACALLAMITALSRPAGIGAAILLVLSLLRLWYVRNLWWRVGRSPNLLDISITSTLAVLLSLAFGFAGGVVAIVLLSIVAMGFFYSDFGYPSYSAPIEFLLYLPPVLGSLLGFGGGLYYLRPSQLDGPPQPQEAVKPRPPQPGSLGQREEVATSTSIFDGASATRPLLTEPREEFAARPVFKSSPFSYSLSSLMLLVTLLSLFLGVMVLAPGLGIFLSALGLPALIRALIFTRRRAKSGRQPKVEYKLEVFLSSISVAFLAWVCSGIALIVFCVPLAALFAEFEPKLSPGLADAFAVLGGTLFLGFGLMVFVGVFYLFNHSDDASN